MGGPLVSPTMGLPVRRLYCGVTADPAAVVSRSCLLMLITVRDFVSSELTDRDMDSQHRNPGARSPAGFRMRWQSWITWVLNGSLQSVSPPGAPTPSPLPR